MAQPTQEQLKELIELYQSGKLDKAEIEAQNLLKQFPDLVRFSNHVFRGLRTKKVLDINSEN